MKINIKTFLLILSLTSLVGFNTGDEVELDTFLNARTSANFQKNAKNLAATLSKGTTGEVLEIKKFPSSGNSGVKMKITSGPKSGESYWVYYNKNNPGIKLTNKEKKEVPPEVVEVRPNGETTEAISAEALRDINARQETEEQILEQAVQTATDTLQLDVVQNLTSPEPIKCQQVEPVIPLLKAVPEKVQLNSLEDYDESIVQAPPRESFDPSAFQVGGPCALDKKNLLWWVCRQSDFNNENFPSGFEFFNYSRNRNRIVPFESPETHRFFSFKYGGTARSDIGLFIMDAPDNLEAHLRTKMLVFLPRDVMPAIRKSETEDVLIMTLPTREEVRFNSKTKEIIGGVLTEGPIVQGPKGHAKDPDVQYTGSGVVIEASAHLSPVGFEGKPSDNKNTVTIKKKGQKTCTVLEREMWVTEPKNYNTPVFKKEFVTDAATDKFIIKKCGFSIY